MGKKLSIEEFIKRARAIHDNKYDYSKVEYINNSTKVCIVCPTHGEFWQTPGNHLSGKGCPKCANKNVTTIEFINKAQKVHGNKYDYSQVNYINAHQKIYIICKEHGMFLQIPNDHLRGFGCSKCGIEHQIAKQSLGMKEFVNKSKNVHGSRYDYSKVEYKNMDSKVIIVCPIHGEFMQTPYKHIQGQGCPKCNSSKLEEEIRIFLQQNKIEFEEQKKFDWLGLQSLDFYLPQYNMAIECQGEQHFKPIKHFGGVDNLLQIRIRDEKKRKLCEQNHIQILYYSNLGIEYPYEVYESKETLLEKIKE